MKRLFQNRAELIAYVAFGALTIGVGLPVYLGVFAVAESLFHIPLDDKGSAAYTMVYIIAQVLKWIVTVLITFYTNRKWVFHSQGPIKRQFLLFCSSRFVTFFIDLLATYGMIHLLTLWITPDRSHILLGMSPELWAKLIVAILVILLNYFISKLIIFRKRKS